MAMDGQDVQIYQIILAAKAETAAAFAQVRSEMGALNAELQQQTRLLDSSYGQLRQVAFNTANGIVASHVTAAGRTQSAWQQAATGISNSWKSVAGQMTGISTVMNPLGMGPGSTLALGAGAFGVLAVKDAMDYEQAMTKIKSLTKATQADVEQWTPAMVRMSQSTTNSAKSLADGMFYIASSEFHGAEAMKILDIVQKSAAAGLGEVGKIALVTTQSLNAYGQGADHAAEVTDRMKAAVIFGKMDPGGLASPMGRINPLAAALGIGMDQTLALVAAESRSGSPPEIAVTGARAMLTNLLKPQKQTRDALASLGIDAADIPKMIKDEDKGGMGFVNFLLMLRERAGEDTALLTRIFPNVRGSSTLLAATGGKGHSDILRGALENERSSGGSVDKAFEISMQSTSNQAKILQNNFTALAIIVGEMLLPGLNSAFRQISSGLATVIDAVQGASRVFTQLAAIIGLTVNPGRLLAGVIELIATLFITRGVVAAAMFTGTVLRMAAQMAIAAIGAAGYAAEMVAAAAATAAAWLAAAAPVLIIIGVLVAAAGLIYLAWTNNWGGIQEFVGQAIGWIRDRIADFLDWMADHNLGVSKDWRKQWEGLSDGIGTAVHGIATPVTDMKAKLDAALASGTSGAPLIEHLKDILSGVTDITAEGEDAAETMKSSLNLTQLDLGRMGPGGLSGLRDLAALKEDEAGHQDALKESQAALTDLQNAQRTDELKFQQDQLANQAQLLNLKGQSLQIDGQMIVPNQRLKELQLDLKAAAQDVVRLAQDRKVLEADAAMFEQNAQLKRLGVQVSRAQDALQFTRSPAEAMELKSSIDRMQLEAHNIRGGMFGAEDQKTEAEIERDRTALGTNLTKNSIDTDIAKINEALTPLERRKLAIEGTTAALQNQVDIAKSSYDAQALSAQPAILSAQIQAAAIQNAIRLDQLHFNQEMQHYVERLQMSGSLTASQTKDILRRAGLWDDETIKAHMVTEEIERLQGLNGGAAGAAATPGAGLGGPGKSQAWTVVNNYKVDLNNPVVRTDEDRDRTLEFLSIGLEEAAAAGSAFPNSGTEAH